MWILLLIVTTTEASTPRALPTLHARAAAPPLRAPARAAKHARPARHAAPTCIRTRTSAPRHTRVLRPPAHRRPQVPKAFKVIPNLQNWEEVLYLTEPESWSPHAVYQVLLGWADEGAGLCARPCSGAARGRAAAAAVPAARCHPQLGARLARLPTHPPARPPAQNLALRPAPSRLPACSCPT